MPVLVHLADERESVSIKKNGIKPGKFRSRIYCMPVLPQFYVSYQWLRELKRRGVRTYVGVHFKLDSKTMVYAGHYHQGHKYTSLGEAIKEIMEMEDPLGYEILVDRKIEAKEITKIKSLPQNIGWRYKPHSHGQKPCGCKYCQEGLIKSRKIMDRYTPPVKLPPWPVLLEKLKASQDEKEISDLLYQVRQKKRRTNPADLLFLLDLRSDDIDCDLAGALGVFNHKNTKAILLQLAKSRDPYTRDDAFCSLDRLYGNTFEKDIKNTGDKKLLKALAAWKRE